MRIYLSLMALLMCAFAHGQTPGAIVDAATLPNPLDPNGDGWITTTGSAFTGPVDETEFELPFVPIPEYQPEPVPDNQVPSTSCTMLELVGQTSTGVESTYYYYQDPDGIAGNGDERIFFRFRVARLRNSSVAFSILIDTDYKFGFTGPDADPNAVVGNPGFELELSATYKGSADLKIYNTDGTSAPSVVIAAYPAAAHIQSAYALNQDADCSSITPGFVDFYLPFSSLGFLSSTQIRNGWRHQ